MKKQTTMGGLALGFSGGSSSCGSCHGNKAKNYMKSLTKNPSREKETISAERLKKLSKELR